MDTLNFKIRLDAYMASGAVKKYLAGSSYAGAELTRIISKYSLNSEGFYKKFAILVGDIILGFYKIEDTVPLLQQELGIDPRTAALLGADVLEFLAPLSDPNWQPPQEEEEAEIVASAIPAPVATETPTEPEPLRTMRSDMDEVREQLPSYQPTAIPEPVYQSSQPALSSVPSYTTPGSAPSTPITRPEDTSRPRWSSEVSSHQYNPPR